MLWEHGVAGSSPVTWTTWRVRQIGKVAGFSPQCGVFRLRVRVSYTSLIPGYKAVCFPDKGGRTVVQIHLSRPFWHRRQMLSRHTFTVEIAGWIPVGVTISECSSVWESTCFGSTGSQVRVLSFRPKGISSMGEPWCYKPKTTDRNRHSLPFIFKLWRVRQEA